ncbi:MAG: TetR/AcrR family transcriptional regulator [Sneathiellales bacterium]|nr:TetR/AcrR family transcriptional regulator [Sneathiellales bacterium]
MVKRRRRSAAETRAQLLKVAAKELVKNDGALEMVSLAQKAGLSEGLAYHYFGNRAGVIAAVVDDFFDRFEEQIIDVRFDGKTWQDRERQRVSAMISFYFSDPLTPIIFSRLGSDAEVAAVEARRARRQITLAEKNLNEAQKAGDVSKARDPRLMGAMMLGAIRWGIMTYWQSTEPNDQEALFEEIWAAVHALSQAK